MAVRKKGSRSILVDGIRYLWRFPHRPTQTQDDCWPGCHVTIQQPDTQRGCVLVLHFPQFRPDCAPGLPVIPVLPSDVARGIRAAIASGWRGDKQGPQFRVLVGEVTAGEF